MKLLRHSILLVLISFVAACASTEVTDRQVYDGEKLAKPAHIIVQDFTADPAKVPAQSNFAADNGLSAASPSPELLAETEKLGSALAEELVEKLRDAGLPAVRASDQPTPDVNDIVIMGYFVSVDEGSTAKRVIVGFGSGEAEIHVAVEGYQETPEGLRLLGSARVDDHGGKTPGLLLPAAIMAATASPIGLVVGGSVKLAGEITGSDTVEGSAKRTADEIAEQIEKAAQKQGWI